MTLQLAQFSRRFRDAAIGRKLALIIAATCGIAIVVAGCADFAFQSFTLRSTFRRDIAALAEIVADNLSGSVAFGDRKVAVEVLDSLKAKPQIVSAVVLDSGGKKFAAVGEPFSPGVSTSTTSSSRFIGWKLHVVSPIHVPSEKTATLVIVADFQVTFLESLRLFLIAIGCICLGALTIALVIGYMLQRFITVPISRLSQAAGRIGEQHDYNVRVAKLGSDELGALTDAFNGMLERLQSADAELRRTNGALTREVEQRRKLQSELVEASRLAGMAEVATGVLHNVGNVLNSVNVSAGLMREQLQGSRLATLRRTTDLMRAHEADLAGFLANDEKGRRVPPFLFRVVEQLELEQKRFDEELTGLARNIEHIKEIVAVQQTYAKASAVIEQVDLAELIEQAISIQRTSLERHKVKVKREISNGLPAVATDRHKILQVLNNFVANAIHAVKSKPNDQRHVAIAVRSHSENEIALSVADNGEGIPPENMKKIFRQGFTTRREGHGFGLHSGILIVKTLGGTIEAASPGVGLGATFTLRLPLTPSPTAVPVAAHAA